MQAADRTQADKAWGILEAGVKEKSFTKRHDAMLAMGLLAGDPRAANAAEQGLNDHAPEVRTAAAMPLEGWIDLFAVPEEELENNLYSFAPHELL